jgi:hypothetical protein
MLDLLCTKGRDSSRGLRHVKTIGLLLQETRRERVLLYLRNKQSTSAVDVRSYIRHNVGPVREVGTPSFSHRP